MAFRTTTTTNDVVIAGFGAESGSTGNSVFAFTTGAGNPARLRCIVGGVSSNGNGGDIAGTTINDDRIHVAMVSNVLFSNSAGGTVRVWLDGQLVQTVATPAIGPHLYGSLCAGGFRRGATDQVGANCRILYTQSIIGNVSDDEGRQWTLNPWQLFEPQRTWVPQGIAAGIPFLSAATLINITSTTATPRVTLTF